MTDDDFVTVEQLDFHKDRYDGLLQNAHREKVWWETQVLLIQKALDNISKVRAGIKEVEQQND